MQSLQTLMIEHQAYRETIGALLSIVDHNNRDRHLEEMAAKGLRVLIQHIIKTATIKGS